MSSHTQRDGMSTRAYETRPTIIIDPHLGQRDPSYSERSMGHEPPVPTRADLLDHIEATRSSDANIKVH